MLAEVAAKDSLAQDPALLQLSPRRPRQDEAPENEKNEREKTRGDNVHLKNVMSLPCLRSTGFVGSLGESDWSEFRLEEN